jgi:hypothetical protein
MSKTDVHYMDRKYKPLARERECIYVCVYWAIVHTLTASSLQRIFIDWIARRPESRTLAVCYGEEF